MAGNTTKDIMNEIVICKQCGKPEYYGDMRWLNGRCMCRACYRADWEHTNKKQYIWDDLDGPVPTILQYNIQEEMKKRGEI